MPRNPALRIAETLAARLTELGAKINSPTKNIRLTCCRKSDNNGGNGTEQKFTRSKEK